LQNSCSRLLKDPGNNRMAIAWLMNRPPPAALAANNHYPVTFHVTRAR
jgi:hypothetical protein